MWEQVTGRLFAPVRSKGNPNLIDVLLLTSKDATLQFLDHDFTVRLIKNFRSIKCCTYLSRMLDGTMIHSIDMVINRCICKHDVRAYMIYLSIKAWNKEETIFSCALNKSGWHAHS